MVPYTNYGLVVLVGILTSFHCIGMCGPLIFGYTTKNARDGDQFQRAHLLYGVGKILSYTAIGALFGFFGSIIAFTPYAQGAVGMVSGFFLILFALHMLEVLPKLKYFYLKPPVFFYTNRRRYSTLELLDGYDFRHLYR